MEVITVQTAEEYSELAQEQKDNALVIRLEGNDATVEFGAGIRGSVSLQFKGQLPHQNKVSGDITLRFLG